MRFWQGIHFSEVEQLADVARYAEQVGFEGLTLGDHLVTPQTIESPYPYNEDGSVWWDPEAPWPEVWMLAAVLGQHTSSLRFMPLVYILPLRDVFTVAKAISSAAVLTDNRIDLGLGVGWMKDEFLLTGQDFHTRGRRTDEMLDVMRKLFAGGMVEYHGEFHDFSPVQMSPVPSKPVPVHVGGDSAPALRRAARHDGWLGVNYDLEQVPGKLEALQRAREDAGTADRDDYKIVCALNEPPTVDVLQELEALGVTDLQNPPWLFTTGQQTSSVEFKKEQMEQFAESCIRPLNG